MTSPPRLVSLLRPAVLATVQSFCLAHFALTHVGCCALTDGPSMVPTINVRGVWVYTNYAYRRGRGVKVGDVVDFHHPMVPGSGAVKRVVGMPGDFVARGGEGGTGGMMMQVPDGHCWVLGDNLPESRDSRFYGPVPLALVKGKVIAKVLPWSDMGWIENNLKQPEEP